MSKQDNDRALALLVSISNEVAKLRDDVRTLQIGLTRIGGIGKVGGHLGAADPEATRRNCHHYR
jgi:hypothetical protein